ncbi:MAG: hypothetical protein J2P31_17645, partial [Blastocatellia bacterium]|nr:hypothetical protein [Blastocatellia bacterium]
MFIVEIINPAPAETELYHRKDAETSLKVPAYRELTEEKNTKQTKNDGTNEKTHKNFRLFRHFSFVSYFD